MPGDNKKQLNSGAKAFVPGKQLKASAASWKPGKEESTENATASTTTKSIPVPPVPSIIITKPASTASAWGRKTSSAVRSAPSQTTQQTTPQRNQKSQQQQQQNPNKEGWRKGNKPGGGNDGGGNWRSAKKNHDHNRGKDNRRGSNDRQRSGGNNNSSDRNESGWQRGKTVPINLIKPNEGETDAEKAVQRIHALELLSLRLSYVAPPLSWGTDDEPGPPEHCLWDSPTRVQEIDAMTKAPRQAGDVSSSRRKNKEVDTAPPLEECKPLEVNEETRWKAKSFSKDEKSQENEDSDEIVLKKSLLILNKLSLTKFDKLSDDFIESGIGRNEKCLSGAIELIVNKAQDEPHFAAMYAALCLKLANTPMDVEEGAKKGKKFKKMLLKQCQKEFEQEIPEKIAIATEGIEDEEEKQYHADIVKKHYLGHMRFIGELYKGDLISIKIMLYCLPALLEGDKSNTENDDEVDEEKVECFAKLMTTIGSSLEQHSERFKNIGKTDTYDQLSDCWRTVEIMAGKRKDKGPKVSNRIKFMLQDLIEMKENGWVTRRKEETAKTIAQIHKEAAKEAKRSASSGNLPRMGSTGNLRRQGSSGDVRNSGRRDSAPKIDADGFVEVPQKSNGLGRSVSMSSLKQSPEWRQNSFGKSDSRSMPKRNSSGGAFAAFNDTSSRRSSTKSDKAEESLSRVEEKEASVEKAPEPLVTYKTPAECGEKAKNILKEYFVGGDTDDAVLSFDELIGAGAEGSVDRGAKVVESSILMVLEMKQVEVEKFLTIVQRCFSEKKLEAASVTNGVNEPLDMLSDLAIDAPLATSLMVTIVAQFIETGALTFDFLLKTPEYFLSDGNAAQFGCKVLKKVGGDMLVSTKNLEIIEKLMTEDDKHSFSSVKDLLDAQN